jgi:hypothetical protein
VIDRGYPFGEIVQAHQVMKSGRAAGGLVVTT